MYGIIAACFAAFLGISMFANIGITLFAIPWHILNFARECWKQGGVMLKIIALPAFVTGGILHVLVRVIWYGTFLALGAGVIYLIVWTVWQVWTGKPQDIEAHQKSAHEVMLETLSPSIEAQQEIISKQKQRQH